MSLRVAAYPTREPGARTPGPPTLAAVMSLVQGLYYLVTGIWSLVSIGSFQAVTGPKTDLWLVRTVGSLVTVIGGVLVVAGFRRRITAEVSLLAVGSALAISAIGVIYPLRRRISPVYLLDALAEVGLVAGWVVAWFGGGRERRGAAPSGSVEMAE